MNGRTLVLMVAAAAAGVATPGSAQGILGRARDRARQALEQRNQPERCSPSDQSHAANAEFGEDLVTRYLRAQQARAAELRRIAANNTDEGRYFAAVLLRDSMTRRYARYHRHVGPDWARYQRLANMPPSTDVNVNLSRSRQMSAIDDSINPGNVRVPDLSWETQQAANDRLDAAARQAGNVSICEWAGVGEIIPNVVNGICSDRAEGRPERGATEFNTFGRELRVSELRAIRAHAADLAAVLGCDWPSDADLAAAQAAAAAEKAHQDSLATWNACQQRATGSQAGGVYGVSQDSLRAWQAQIEAAQRRGDNATVMAIGMRMSQAMSPQMMGAAQASQACGPMPGQPK